MEAPDCARRRNSDGSLNGHLTVCSNSRVSPGNELQDESNANPELENSDSGPIGQDRDELKTGLDQLRN